MRKGMAVAALSAIILAGCTDAPTAERVLRQQNYKDVRTTGYSLFSCGKGDSFATGFRARAPNGEMVSGVVCSGWLKGATVRVF
jgi:hypothetical protein